jgi:lipoprotein Spr
MFWAKASCYVFSVLFLCCFAAQFAYCQLIIENHGTQLELSNSFFLSFPFKETFTTQIGGLQKGALPLGLYIPVGNKIASGIQQVTKINETEGKDTLAIAAIEADSADNKELVAVGKTPNTINLATAVFDKETEQLISKYTEMVSIEPEEVSSYPLYKFIDEWYGTKYKYGGTDNNGIDCSAFSQKVYGSIYGMHIMRTARQQRRNCELVKSYEDAAEGDLVFFRIHRLRISHVGVYLANGYFVHASRSRGITISSLEEPYWNRRFAGCGKIAREEKTGTESDFLP